MTIEDILNFRPLLLKVENPSEHQFERSLMEIIPAFYASHGIEKEIARQLAKEYVESLKNKFDKDSQNELS